jgi:2-iminobutanoate/2-iminopropanoate deaminase
MPRQSIDIGSFAHQNPLPAASRIGPMIMSSVIAPFDPGTRNMPAEFPAQIENIFHHVEEILDAAGATWDDVLKMTFFVDDISAREMINEPWLKRFPDPAARPARHTMLAPSGGGKPGIRAEFTAYLER